LEQRVLNTLRLYGHESKEFKEAKDQWEVRKGLQEHFKWLDDEASKATAHLEAVEKQLKKEQEFLDSADQGKEEDDGAPGQNDS